MRDILQTSFGRSPTPPSAQLCRHAAALSTLPLPGACQCRRPRRALALRGLRPLHLPQGLHPLPEALRAQGTCAVLQWGGGSDTAGRWVWPPACPPLRVSPTAQLTRFRVSGRRLCAPVEASSAPYQGGTEHVCNRAPSPLSLVCETDGGSAGCRAALARPHCRVDVSCAAAAQSLAVMTDPWLPACPSPSACSRLQLPPQAQGQC